MGSYVPADSAEMYCLDGVYTRMGAGDDLAADMSTFMVRDRAHPFRTRRLTKTRNIRRFNNDGKGYTRVSEPFLQYSKVQ